MCLARAVLLWTLAALPLTALAQELQAPKVGYVNVTRVLEVAPQAVAAQARIKEEFAPRDERLLEQQRTLRQREDALINAPTSLGSDERAQQEAEIRSLKRELRRAQDEFREDLGVRRSEELAKLQRQVAETIRDLAQAQRFDVVLSNGVVFASERIDLTEAVLEQLRGESQP